MMNNLTTMSKIAKFWSELTSTTDNSITKQLEQIKENFRTEVQGCLQ
jgi:muramidase (phage lysozyme)